MSFVFVLTDSCRRRALLAAMLVGFASPLAAQDLTYTDAPLSDVLHAIADRTEYRFLYRDALIAEVHVALEASSHDVLARLSAALAEVGLSLETDALHRTIFVLPLRSDPVDSSNIIRGTVSDAITLERLPHATLTWVTADGREGIACDEGGRFLIRLRPSPSEIVLVASFLGYAPDTLRLDATRLPPDLAIKLRPRVVLGAEVVVSSPLLSTNLDSAWHYLLGTSITTPAGDKSVSRALQLLPSVGLTTAVSAGLNVRGSRTDGFQILLDGVPIFNQSHLFGLFDAFSPDALQAVDFYYAVAPARLQAPPGGTLSYLTRAGSKRSAESRIGLTSMSISTTLEGPLARGKGSWLVSARRSYLDEMTWLNNDGLVSLGLGTDRENSGTRRVPLDDRTLRASQPSALFYDIHAKVEHETSGGATIQLTAYVGGDEASQRGERIVALAPAAEDPVVRAPVATVSDWGNAAFSAHHRSAVSAWGYTHTYLGVTHYRSSFRKDDFFYRVPGAVDQAPDLLFAPFLNENRLTEGRLAAESWIYPSPTLNGSFGFSLHRVIARYSELSALRREFARDDRAWQFDSFAELTYASGGARLVLGARSHYFSSGNFLRLSPRVNANLFAHSPLSLSLGYSRNYQFIHHLSVENSPAASLWVLSTVVEKPTVVDHLTSSLLYKSGATSLELSAYLKYQDNVRRHETLLRPGAVPRGAILLVPWSHDNQSRARGIEVLLSRRLGRAALAATYGLSRVLLRHPEIQAGELFYADWDRRHHLRIHAALAASQHLSLSMATTVASGNPNPLAFLDPNQPSRNSPYHRIDAGVEYTRPLPGLSVSAFLRIYNLFDTNNTWYRTLETVLTRRQDGLALAFEPIDVYDLGFHPTFGVTLSF